MRIAVVVGNPKPQSRTLEAAQIVAEKLTGRPPDVSLDLTDFGARLLDWSDQSVADAVRQVRASHLVVFASPTFKAGYTGLLKLFLDQMGDGALSGVTAVPMMLGGDWRHALAADAFLKPVLVELGATCPTPGLFLLASEYAASEALDSWLSRARPQVAATVSSECTTEAHKRNYGPPR
jgi:FMN reductase